MISLNDRKASLLMISRKLNIKIFLNTPFVFNHFQFGRIETCSHNFWTGSFLNSELTIYASFLGYNEDMREIKKAIYKTSNYIFIFSVWKMISGLYEKVSFSLAQWISKVHNLRMRSVVGIIFCNFFCKEVTNSVDFISDDHFSQKNSRSGWNKEKINIQNPVWAPLLYIFDV